MSLFCAINSVISLSNVQRYSQNKFAMPENVLEHSGAVAMLSYYISFQLIMEGYDIDLGVVLSKAIFHDIDEVITGDIARPIKYHSKELRELIGKMEDDSVLKIDSQMKMVGNLYNTWSNAKIGDGAIVKLCDYLCVIYKIYDEVCNRGNRHAIKYLFSNSDRNLPFMQLNKFVDELREFLGKSSKFINNLEKEAEILISNVQSKIED